MLLIEFNIFYQVLSRDRNLMQTFGNICKFVILGRSANSYLTAFTATFNLVFIGSYPKTFAMSVIICKRLKIEAENQLILCIAFNTYVNDIIICRNLIYEASIHTIPDTGIFHNVRIKYCEIISTVNANISFNMRRFKIFCEHGVVSRCVQRFVKIVYRTRFIVHLENIRRYFVIFGSAANFLFCRICG